MSTIEQAMAHGLRAQQAGRFELARSVYEAIVRQAPRHPVSANAWANLAALHERHNRVEQAVSSAEQALFIDAGHPVAGLIAARCLRRNGAYERSLQQLEAIPPDRHTSGLMFEQARVLDCLGRYDEAYRTYVVANQSRTEEFPGVNRTVLPRMIAETRRCFTEDWVDGWFDVSPGDRPTPLFLVGFNRSGTTLLDRMLDAHPDVSVLEEVAAIDEARRVLGGRYPGGLSDIGDAIAERARAAYFSVVDRHVPSTFSGTVVDKLPLNTISLGLIYRLFPDARVVMSLRHPADVVMSNFMQSYRPNPITIHFDSIASASRIYADIMGLGVHLRQVLPLPVMDLRYEDLVQNWEGEIRRLLDFAGLDWNDNILDYRGMAVDHGHIDTPSYDQVVEPVYSRSIGRWRNYMDAFAPAWDHLMPFIQRFGYTD